MFKATLEPLLRPADRGDGGGESDDDEAEGDEAKAGLNLDIEDLEIDAIMNYFLEHPKESGQTWKDYLEGFGRKVLNSPRLSPSVR